MGHTDQCSGATKTDCRCQCGGLYHGLLMFDGGPIQPIPSKWLSYVEEAVEPPRRVCGYSGYQALRRAATRGSVAWWLVDNPGACDDLGRLAGPALWREIHRLSRRERRKLGKADHRICRLLEDMATALAKVAGDLSERTAAAIAERVFPLGSYPSAQQVRVKVMRAALKTILQRVFDSMGVIQLDVVVRALRVAAVMACPDVNLHPSLEEKCVEPLADEVAKTTITSELQQAARQWLHRASAG